MHTEGYKVWEIKMGEMNADLQLGDIYIYIYIYTSKNFTDDACKIMPWMIYLKMVWKKSSSQVMTDPN